MPRRRATSGIEPKLLRQLPPLLSGLDRSRRAVTRVEQLLLELRLFVGRHLRFRGFWRQVLYGQIFWCRPRRLCTRIHQ